MVVVPYGALKHHWYAPGASVAYLVEYLNDQKKMIACSVLLKESMSKMIFVLVFLYNR
jgi:hypothetical protein